MASRQTNSRNGSQSKRPPATTPEARENQLIAKAVDLAERQLEDGTASAQVISHYLKLGSSRERLEQKRLEHDIELMAAKKENMAVAARIEELYGEAIQAMRNYSGQVDPEEAEEEYYDD